MFLVVPAHTTAEYTSLKISELVTGTQLGASEEFVEIYNPSLVEMPLDGVLLQYKSANGSNWPTKARISEIILPSARVIIATLYLFVEYGDIEMSGGSVAGGSHIRIVQELEGDEELLAMSRH